MDLTKLSKTELLVKREENGISFHLSILYYDKYFIYKKQWKIY
jgi:hypothetical protein